MSVAAEHTAVMMPLDALRADPKNPRTINRAALERLKLSITTYGFVQPVLFNERTGYLVAGHQRAEAARELGYSAIPTVVVDYDPRTQQGANIAFNSEYGEFDQPKLRALVYELRAEDYNLDTLALPTYTIEAILQAPDYQIGAALGEGHLAATPASPPPSAATSDDTVEDTGDPDVLAPESKTKVIIPATKLDVTPRVAKGDVWLLGETHLLVCADVRAPGVMDALLPPGDPINLVVTSPPYASQRKYDEHSGFTPIKPERYVAWFQDVQAAFASRLAADGSYFLNIKAHAEGGERHIYVADLVDAHRRQWGWKLIDEFAWERPGVPGSWPNRFKNSWEPIFHFARSPQIHFDPYAVSHESDAIPIKGSPIKDEIANGTHWHKPVDNGPGMALPSNVLHCRALQTGTGHSAVFPPDLPRFFIKAFSRPGDTVFDPFTGSGTSLIVADAEGRRFIGTEISPEHCDTVLAWYEQATNGPVARIGQLPQGDD